MNDLQNQIGFQKALSVEATETVRDLPGVLNVLVAGGCPRDWFFEKPGKDIDVFIQTEWQSDISPVIFKLLEVYGNIKKIEGEYNESDKVDEDYLNSDIAGVYECTVSDQVLQFIFVNNSIEFMVSEMFPSSIQRAIYDGYSTYYSDDFVRSVMSNTITFNTEKGKETFKNKLEHLPHLVNFNMVVG